MRSGELQPAPSRVKKTGQEYSLGCTQYHFNMEGRKILSTGTLEEYKKNRRIRHEHDENSAKNLSLYQEFKYRLCLGHGY